MDARSAQEQAEEVADEEVERQRRQLLLEDQKVKEFFAQIASQTVHSGEMITEFSNPRKSTMEKWQFTQQLADVSRLYHDAAELRCEALVRNCLNAEETDGLVRLLALKALLSILAHGCEQDKQDVPHHERSHPTEGPGVLIPPLNAQRHTGPIGGFSLALLEPSSRVVSGIAELTYDSFLPVRRGAVQGLRLLGITGIGAADRLGMMVLTERDPKLRSDIVETLGTFGIQAIEVLFRVLSGTTIWSTKIETCHAIAKLTDWRRAKPCQEILDIRLRLAELLEDRDEDVRKAACYCLGHMSVKAIACVPKLIMLMRDRHIRVRAASVWALAEIGHGYETLPEGARTLADETSVEEKDENWNAWQKGHTALKMMLDLSGAVTLTDVICRSLTSVIRDLEPFRTFLHEARPDEKLDIGIKGVPPGRAGRDDTSDERPRTPREQSAKLHDAADKAFERLGKISLEPLCNRLASSEDGGFSSRMSVMRSMYATKLMSLPVIACFAAEWVLMDGKDEWLRDKERIDVWKRSLPLVYEAKLLEYGTTDQVIWALIKRDVGAVILTFGVQEAHRQNWMNMKSVTFQPVDMYDESGEIVGQLNVHAGFYNMLDGCFDDICRALKRSGAVDGLHRLNCVCICGGGIGGSVAQMMTLRLLCERAPLGEMKLPLAPVEEEADPALPVPANPFAHDPVAVTWTATEAAGAGGDAKAGASVAGAPTPVAAASSPAAGHCNLPSEARAKAHGKSKPQPPATMNGSPPPQVGAVPVLSDAKIASDRDSARRVDAVEEDPNVAKHGGLTCITFGATSITESTKRMPVDVSRMLEAKFQVFRNQVSSSFQFAQDPLPFMLRETIDVFRGIQETKKPAGFCSKRKKVSKYAQHQEDFEQGGSLWAPKYGSLFKNVDLDAPVETLQKALYAGEVRYGQFNEAMSKMEIYTNAMARRLAYLFWSRDEHFARLKAAEDERAAAKAKEEETKSRTSYIPKISHVLAFHSLSHHKAGARRLESTA